MASKRGSVWETLLRLGHRGERLVTCANCQGGESIPEECGGDFSSHKGSPRSGSLSGSVVTWFSPEIVCSVTSRQPATPVPVRETRFFSLRYSITATCSRFSQGGECTTPRAGLALGSPRDSASRICTRGNVLADGGQLAWSGLAFSIVPT